MNKMSYLASVILWEATTLLNISVEQIWLMAKNVETIVSGIMVCSF